jgi:hypothetical protein
LLFDGWYQYPLRPNLPNFFWYRPYTEPRRPYAFSENRPAWVESEVRALELLAVRTEWQGMTTPPPVRLYGAIRHGEKKWVIENIEWGDSIMDVTTGRLLRQQATVHLIEHYQPGALAKLPRGRAG